MRSARSGREQSTKVCVGFSKQVQRRGELMFLGLVEVGGVLGRVVDSRTSCTGSVIAIADDVGEAVVS